MFKFVFKDLQDIKMNLILSLVLAGCQTSTYEGDQQINEIKKWMNKDW